MSRLVALVVLLSLVLITPAAATAQDASPAASPMAGPCEAPELPPGTPTAMEDATPAAEAEATPGVDEAQAELEEATPEPLPAGTPISGDEADAAVAGLENLINCLNGGDYLAVAALMTDNFLQNFIEVPTRYDVPASLEGAQPIETRMVGDVQTYGDGRISVDWVYAGLFNGPGGLSSERWFFVEEDGYLKLDNIQPAPMPESALPGATVVTVQMVDFAFALDTTTIPSGPVIFRTTNASAAGNPHVNVVVTLQEEVTPEQVIRGEVNVDEVFTGFFGAVFLEPGGAGDIAFENLEPGTYFLVCDVETEDGTPHFELGMVTQITVE